MVICQCVRSAVVRSLALLLFVSVVQCAFVFSMFLLWWFSACIIICQCTYWVFFITILELFLFYRVSTGCRNSVEFCISKPSLERHPATNTNIKHKPTQSLPYPETAQRLRRKGFVVLCRLVVHPGRRRSQGIVR